jgi:hypothetical protein
MLIGRLTEELEFIKATIVPAQQVLDFTDIYVC